MPMIVKGSCLIFELNTDSLPSTATNMTLGLAIREPLLYGLNSVPDFMCDHSKEKNYTLLVYRSMLQASKIKELTVLLSTLRFPLWRRRRNNRQFIC